jgi:hypothetical protein
VSGVIIARALQRIPPATRVLGAEWLFIVSTVAWPISQFTWASSEPPNVLALSWLAIIVTCIDIIVSADAREAIEKGTE